MSASVSRTLYSLIATTGFTDLLDDVTTGALATRRGYTATYDALGGDLALPWRTRHWSRFWSNYLPGAGQLRQGPGSDRAWEYVLPFEVVPEVPIDAGGGATGALRRYLYPWAVVSVADVELDRVIPAAQLAASVAKTRRDRVWQLPGEAGAHNLDHLLRRATEQLRDRLFTTQGLELPGVTTVRSVTAPTQGDLSETEVALPGQTGFDPLATGATIAGLAVLAPPSVFRDERLVAANSSGDRATRVYVAEEGHVLWSAQHLRGDVGTSSGSLACLLRNHADSVSHIEALVFAMRWAADRVRSKKGLSDGQAALISPVLHRLRSLHEGDKNKTYASDVAKRRIEPFLADIDVAASGL
jgi:hypothetical protein